MLTKRFANIRLSERNSGNAFRWARRVLSNCDILYECLLPILEWKSVPRRSCIIWLLLTFSFIQYCCCSARTLLSIAYNSANSKRNLLKRVLNNSRVSYKEIGREKERERKVTNVRFTSFARTRRRRLTYVKQWHAYPPVVIV